MPTLTEPISLPAGANGSAVCAAPDGSVWVGLEGANALVRVDTATQTAGAAHPIPTPNAGMGGIAVTPDGRVWFTEFKTDKLGVYDPSANTITEYPLPAGSGGGGIVYQPADGNLWALLTLKSQWGVFNLSGVQTAAYPIPSGSTVPHGPCIGPDGNIWFGEIDKAKVGKITPTGIVSEYAVPGCKPTVCVAGADGNVYFSDQNGNIGRVRMGTFVVDLWPVLTPSGVPYGLASASDGSIVYTLRAAGKVGVMPMGGGLPVEYACPSGAGCQPNKCTEGDDGAVWGAERAGQKVFRFGA